MPSQLVALKDGWMRVWIGMTGGMDKHWGEKELPRVGHQLASCSLLISYVLMFLLSFSCQIVQVGKIEQGRILVLDCMM